jgi:hypothetical protein
MCADLRDTNRKRPLANHLEILDPGTKGETMMQPQTSIPELFSEPRQDSPHRKTRNSGRPRGKRKQTNLPLHSPLERLSALLLPITLLVLLSLIVWGLTENTWFVAQPRLQPDHATIASFVEHSHKT